MEIKKLVLVGTKENVGYYISEEDKVMYKLDFSQEIVVPVPVSEVEVKSYELLSLDKEEIKESLKEMLKKKITESLEKEKKKVETEKYEFRLVIYNLKKELKFAIYNWMKEKFSKKLIPHKIYSKVDKFGFIFIVGEVKYVNGFVDSVIMGDPETEEGLNPPVFYIVDMETANYVLDLISKIASIDVDDSVEGHILGKVIITDIDLKGLGDFLGMDIAACLKEVKDYLKSKSKNV